MSPLNACRRRRSTLFFLMVSLAATAGLTSACSRTPVKAQKGIYHEVQEGQTLWRICHAYRANMQTVCRVNRIPDPERIEVGQRIFIPGARSSLQIQPAAILGKAATGQAATGKRGSQAGRGGARSGAAALRSPSSGTAASDTALSFIWPVKGPVTSWFGVRHGRRHDGLDIAVSEGTPIFAAESGIVIYSGNEVRGYGNVVIIRHSDGFSTVYAHNLSNRVRVDQVVTKGRIIGFVGKSGTAEGYHLHFEIRHGVRPVDPMAYLP